MVYNLTNIPETGFNIIKWWISAWSEKIWETITNFASWVWSSIGTTLSDTYAPAKEYITSTVKNIPWYFKSDVIDATINDLKFTWFKASPIMTTTKAIFSPVILLPRAAWATTKSVWSTIWNSIIGMPKWVWNTAGALVWWVWSFTGNIIKWVTGTVGAWLKTIDGMVDWATGWWSKSDSKK